MPRTVRIDVSPASGSGPKPDGKGPHRRDSGSPGDVLEHESYRQLLAGIYDAVVITTAYGEIVDANPRSLDVLLFDVDELQGKNILELISGSDDELLDAIAGNLKNQRFTLLTAYCVRKDGSTFSAEVAVSRLVHDGRSHMCFFIRDLTVREQAEKALREALQRLEKHDKHRSLLGSNIAHELRTPLASLTYGVTNLLKGVGGPVTDKMRSYLNRLDRECKRLLATVHDILDLERLDQGRLVLAKIRIPIARVVAKCCESLAVQAEHKGIKMVQHSAKQDSSKVFALCDPNKIERALLNIIGNSVKYTPRGGRVDVETMPSPDRAQTVLLTVGDTGMGIPEHAIDFVTERYYRTGESADGAGLGLAIACEIVEKHGWQLRVESPPPGRQQGTLVSVTLDTVDAPSLLVVDDDPSVCKLMKGQLEVCGYGVNTVGSAEAALGHLQKNRADLLILDLLMPEMDGIELIHAIRKDPLAARIPVVLVSGSDLDEEQFDSLGNMSVPILKKPWDVDELLGAVEAGFMGVNAT